MGKFKMSEEDKENLRNKMCQAIGVFCDDIQSKGEEQVTVGLEELEKNFNKASLEAIFAQCQDNNQESNSLLPEQQQELRNRIYSGVHPEHEGPGFTGQKPGPEKDFKQKGLHHMSPEAQKPGESFCDRVLRLFQKMLQRLRKTWQAVLAWVQEKLAFLLSTVQFIFSEIKSFYFNVAEFFSSSFQV